jgi:hypothetical protein
MLSWIFRHRQRLGVIYGRTRAPALAGPRFSPPRALLSARPADLRPGELARRGRFVELRPMHKRAI